MATKNRIGFVRKVDRAEKARAFVLPNPGDVIMSMLFGWAFFCFFLVIGGRSFLVQIALLATSSELRSLLLAGDETILAGLMLAGSLAIVCLVLFYTKFNKLFICMMIFALIFAGAGWAPLHDAGLIIKYSGVLMLSFYSGIFIIKNFWRIVGTPFFRLLALYLAWVGGVCIFIGGKSDDFWYLGSEVVMIVGWATVWLSFIKSKENLVLYNQLLAWTALIVAGLVLVSPLVIDTYIDNGRFKSYWSNATGFAVLFAPCVLTLFWMGMYEKNDLIRPIFSAAAIVALILVFWSGTRSASLGLVIAITLLWLVFRTRIFVYLFLFACVGLAAQISGTIGDAEVQALASRLQSTGDSSRFIIWETYAELIAESPVYGYSVTGVARAFYGDTFVDLVGSYGGRASVTSAHNAYLGLTARFGLVALIIFLFLIFFALRRARAVLLSAVVPQDEKQVYVLPVALLVLICIEVLFEDGISGRGRGVFSGFIFFSALIICEIYGRRLLAKYEAVRSAKDDGPTVAAALNSAESV